MLTTRCPDCRTTFRITSKLLHRAGGQVRCGQCLATFDAFESLEDPQRRTRDMSPASQNPYPRDLQPPREESEAEETEPPLQDEPAPAETTQESRDDDSAEEYPTDDLREDHAAAAESADDAHDEQAAGAESSNGVSEDQVTAEEPPDAEHAAAAQPWHPAEPDRRESRGWRAAAAIAAVFLVLQAVHHYRGELAVMPYVGNPLERVYERIGMPIPEDTDPSNFAIVDWVATAQQSDGAQPGSLEISAGIRNESNKPLSYPMLSLELTDRWEKTIGARVFMPEEYLGRNVSRGSKIPPNSTVMAQLRLVDPGPDAYGFEVDVCVALDAQSMRCKTDAVFQ